MATPTPVPVPVNFEEREAIVKEIREIKVEHGQSLRQVQVSDETYRKAKKFVLKAPNTLQDLNPFRFKILWSMPSGRSIYELLGADAGNTTLEEADAKITEWIDASKSLLRYALNLILAPKRPEFQRLKLSNSYYVYQVAKKLKDAQEILHAMGYEAVGGSQELKYKGDVDSVRVTDTAADLVILVGELERVKSLVQYSRNERLPIVLTHILQVRADRTSIYDHAKYALDKYANPSSASPQRRRSPAAHDQTPQHTAAPQQYTPAQRSMPMQHRNEHSHGQQRLGVYDHQQPGGPQAAHLNPDSQPRTSEQHTSQQPQSNKRRVSGPVVHPRGHHEQQQPFHSNAKNRAHYQNLPLFSDALQEVRERQAAIEAKDHEQCHHHLVPNDPAYANVQQTYMPPQADTYQRGNPTLVPQSHQQVHGYGTPEEPTYANVQRQSAQRGAYEQVGPPASRVPMSPPNPMDLPEPIVQSASELEKMNLMTSDAPFDPDSIVNARSDAVPSSGPYLYSLMSSYADPEQASLFNRQVEDAWRVDTPPAHSEQPSQNVVNVFQEKSRSAETSENNLVTQEWLDENQSESDPDYQNWQAPASAKNLKQYDKPVPDMKQKFVTEQLANQTSRSDSYRQEHGSHLHPSHSSSGGTSPSTSFENTKPRKPMASPRTKAKSTPLEGRSSEDVFVPQKPHTSPQSSLESNNQPSLGDAHHSVGQGTLEYEDGEFTVFEQVSPRDQRASLKTDFHTSPAPPSLPPIGRPRSDAISPKTSPPLWQKKAARVGVSSAQSECNTAAKDKPTEKFLDTMSGGQLSKVEQAARSRSTTHTDLDKHSSAARAQYRSQKLASIDHLKTSNAPVPANVGGTWTCEYCYNMVFDLKQDFCDVCGEGNPGTYV